MQFVTVDVSEVVRLQMVVVVRVLVEVTVGSAVSVKIVWGIQP